MTAFATFNADKTGVGIKAHRRNRQAGSVSHLTDGEEISRLHQISNLVLDLNIT